MYVFPWSIAQHIEEAGEVDVFYEAFASSHVAITRLLDALCPPLPHLEFHMLTCSSDYSMLAKTSVHHFNGNNVSLEPP